jgi:hypothetical protein
MPKKRSRTGDQAVDPPVTRFATLLRRPLRGQEVEGLIVQNQASAQLDHASNQARVADRRRFERQQALGGGQQPGIVEIQRFGDDRVLVVAQQGDDGAAFQELCHSLGDGAQELPVVGCRLGEGAQRLGQLVQAPVNCCQVALHSAKSPSRTLPIVEQFPAFRAKKRRRARAGTPGADARRAMIASSPQPRRRSCARRSALAAESGQLPRDVARYVACFPSW